MSSGERVKVEGVGAGERVKVEGVGAGERVKVVGAGDRLSRVNEGVGLRYTVLCIAADSGRSH